MGTRRSRRLSVQELDNFARTSKLVNMEVPVGDVIESLKGMRTEELELGWYAIIGSGYALIVADDDDDGDTSPMSW